ncbi:MAG: adenylyltransferase/cytidyltransferase family protein [Methylohalobius sp.]|nr:adenylyltransferase/cytidyltransferase family protein [Methylohalobius sp.]
MLSPRWILACGVFDLLHVGHVRYLQAARALGDRLKVAVAPDEFCLARKGRRPTIPGAQRLELIRALACVDAAEYMLSSLDDTAVAAAWISAWGIHCVAVGADWQGSPRWLRLEPALAQHGIAVRFLPRTAGVSTSAILAKIRASS